MKERRSTSCIYQKLSYQCFNFFSNECRDYFNSKLRLQINDLCVNIIHCKQRLNAIDVIFEYINIEKSTLELLRQFTVNKCERIFYRLETKLNKKFNNLYCRKYVNNHTVKKEKWVKNLTDMKIPNFNKNADFTKKTH